MKLLIIGHGRHGKDFAAEYLRDQYGLTFESSSMFAANEFLFEALAPIVGYKTVQECYRDRHNNRQLWHDLICEFNSEDPAKLAKSLLDQYDIYVGMRSDREYEACVRAGLFDHIVWIDAMDRVGYVDPTLHIQYDDSMLRVDNNGLPSQMYAQLDDIWETYLKSC